MSNFLVYLASSLGENAHKRFGLAAWCIKVQVAMDIDTSTLDKHNV